MQQQEPNFALWEGIFLKVIRLVLGSGAASCEVFLHRRFGSRHLGPQAATVFLVVPVFASFFPHEKTQPFAGFLAAYLLLLIVARINIWVRRRKHDSEHSFYSGWPILLRRSANRFEYVVKQFVEPLLVFLVACEIAPLNRPLGCYLLFAMFCLAITTLWTKITAERELLDANDALLEQQIFADRMREHRGY